MSQKDIFELRNVGVLSREEITKAIESIVQSGKIVYHEREEESKTIIETAPESSRLSELLPEIESIRLDDVPFSVRARNALKRANIQTADELVQMSEKDIMGLRNVGAQTRDEILAVINAIIREGRAYFDNLTSQYDQKHGDEPIVESASKGFDFAVIDILTERFGFKPAKMTEWFGLSRQSVYNALGKRLPQRRSTWTGKTISESELSILAKLIENKSFDYIDDEVTCCCMNNRQDDFVCLFIYENEIKCLFLKDLPYEIREQVVSKKMHMYTERELAGESDGRVINVLTKPFYRPDNPERFRANAQFRGMTSDECAVFISGYPYLDQRSVTDEQIVAFMKENMVDGKVYISSDPKNQWIRSIASRNGYTIKSFIELYGFESRLDGSELTSDAAKEEAGHILIRPCYIDQIQYCGMEDTSEGYCPVYSGILYTTGYHGERYEFSYDVHTNKKGITKMLVNPVRIVYISDTALCITDPDGDGLYYYNYYDRSLESVVFALTDHEYTKANKQKYSNADLYSYRTERV